MNARCRTAVHLVTVAAVIALAPARAFAADAVPSPPPVTPSPAGVPAPPPTVTVDAPAVPSAAMPPSPPNGAPSPTDLALKRVLRSSCRDGLDDLRAAGADPSTPWAATVARMCDDIVLEKKRTITGGNEGRGRLVLWSSLYGIWLGIATDIMFEIDGDRAVIVAPLLGLGAGLGLSLAATSNTQLTVGEAWTIITGLDYGTINGALWAGGLDMSDKGVVGTAVATSVAATSLGVLVASEKSPTAGDIEVVRSGLLWGAVGGALATFAIAPDASSTSAFKAIAASMDAGFLVGVGVAKSFDLSRNRVLIIDAGALTGGLFGLGIAWLAAGTDNSGRGLAAASLGGMLAGIGVAAWATRHLDAQDVAVVQAPSLPAMLARDADGRWRFGTPGALPVFDGHGSRVVGATATVVGGLF
jgi:hypothetical protein